MKWYVTACPRNCYSSCGFRVKCNEGKIVGIDKLSSNVATKNGPCVKGQSYINRVYNPERVTSPLLKDKNGFFKKISWEEAIDIIADKINNTINRYGSKSIFYLAGSGMSGILNGFAYDFWKRLGGVTLSYGNLCWPAGLEATRLTLGDNKHNHPWDIENADLIILWGKNPAETNIHQMDFIYNAIDKGAKLISIDPRRTKSSHRADLKLSPKQGTDAALALAVSAELIKRGNIDNSFINTHVKGFDNFADSIKNCSLEWASDICDIDVSEIKNMVDLIGQSNRMSVVPGYGMQRYSNGGQTIRSVLTIPVITGNIGKSGTGWYYANLQSYIFDDVKEPISYRPEICDSDFRRTISTPNIAVDMLNQKNPELKVAWIERANPLTQYPDTNLIFDAFQELDFIIVSDQFMTDTAMSADIVLPAKTMFEQSDIVSSYWNPYIQIRQKVIDPPENVKTETEVYSLLADKIGLHSGKEFLYPVTDKQVDDYLSSLLSEKGIDYNELKKAPVIHDSVQEIAFSDYMFNTESGKIELWSDEANKLWGVSELPQYVPLDDDSDYDFAILSPNSHDKIHSQFGNLDIISDHNPVPVIYGNPDDLIPLKIKDDSLVRVYNSRGEIFLKCRYDFSIKRGCLSLDNGWWMSQGASVNMLSKSGFTDMGYGAALHNNRVSIERL
jgi:anaerobic selenocysteine-containing dehydrogenase